MGSDRTRQIFTSIEKIIENFDIEKSTGKNDKKDYGITYTPKIIVDHIVFNILKIFFDEFINIKHLMEDISYRNNFFKDQELFELVFKKIRNIKILDPACGSGRFLISAAENIFRLHKILNPNLPDFELKRKIIENNIHGVEIQKSACSISKLRLIVWLFSDNQNLLNHKDLYLNNGNGIDIDQIIVDLNFNFKIYNLDFLLDFNLSNYDIVIGNPPYIENKKIQNLKYKKKLAERFKSAYRLFDLSIIFLERAIELMRQQTGCLSMIMTNKFLSADYGIKIRQLLIEETELKEIINISSIPIFEKTAAYPIIISFKKSIPSSNNSVIIKKYKEVDELIKNVQVEISNVPQQLIKHLPGIVFPISSNINLITFLYTHYKPISKLTQDLKIIYRPFGFLNWAKHLDNLYPNKSSDEDLLLIGTGNVGKFHIIFDKQIKIAKRTLNISFIKYQNEFKKIWKEIHSEKLIFREIAKELTFVYDTGIFTNVTGLYFLRIPSFNEERLLCLLTILNSKLIDLVFKALFGSLHMSGGYLRYNGSFIKRIPMPNKFPLFLSQIGKILQFLSQLQYDLKTYFSGNFNKFDINGRDYGEIDRYLDFFKKLSNSLINVLYLEKYYIHSKMEFQSLKELLYSKPDPIKIQLKFLLPRFRIKKYEVFQIKELKSMVGEIKHFYDKISKNKALINEMECINKEDFLMDEKSIFQ